MSSLGSPKWDGLQVKIISPSVVPGRQKKCPHPITPVWCSYSDGCWMNPHSCFHRHVYCFHLQCLTVIKVFAHQTKTGLTDSNPIFFCLLSPSSSSCRLIDHQALPVVIQPEGRGIEEHRPGSEIEPGTGFINWTNCRSILNWILPEFLQ